MGNMYVGRPLTGKKKARKRALPPLHLTAGISGRLNVAFESGTHVRTRVPPGISVRL